MYLLVDGTNEKKLQTHFDGDEQGWTCLTERACQVWRVCGCPEFVQQPFFKFLWNVFLNPAKTEFLLFSQVFWKSYCRFGCEFNRSLERVSLPSSSSFFGASPNPPLIFPTQKPMLVVDSIFRHPRPVEATAFCWNRTNWGLEDLTFGYCFNKPLDHVKLPDGLKHLTFGSNFQQSLESVPRHVGNVELPGRWAGMPYGCEDSPLMAIHMGIICIMMNQCMISQCRVSPFSEKLM